MDLGTGKVPKSIPKLKVKSVKFKVRRNGDFYSEGVRHWMLDIASPAHQYSVAQWQRGAEHAIADIVRRGKIPIICGGTGFYIDTLVYGLTLPAVPPDKKLRERFNKLSARRLFKILKKLDPERSLTIDRRNKRRLIRALEIIAATGKPVPAQVQSEKFKVKSDWNVLYLGMSIPKKKLVRRIEKRLDARLKRGMVAEVRRLHAEGVSWKRLEDFGLEYRWIACFLQKKISYAEMKKGLLKAIVQYSKRQMTWFKRNHVIKWIRTGAQAQKLVRRFLSA